VVAAAWPSPDYASTIKERRVGSSATSSVMGWPSQEGQTVGWKTGYPVPVSAMNAEKIKRQMPIVCAIIHFRDGPGLF
jgi:hypothetical protein